MVCYVLGWPFDKQSNCHCPAVTIGNLKNNCAAILLLWSNLLQTNGLGYEEFDYSGIPQTIHPYPMEGMGPH